MMTRPRHHRMSLLLDTLGLMITLCTLANTGDFWSIGRRAST